jgi:hypothetical protein
VKATGKETLRRGWALPAARRLVLGWTWLYTAALTEQARTARREEIRSDMHDHIEQDRGKGSMRRALPSVSLVAWRREPGMT